MPEPMPPLDPPALPALLGWLGIGWAALVVLAAAFGAKTLDATLNSFVFEVTGTTEEIDRFIGLMTVIGLVEISRTGIAAMGRGSEAM